MPWSGSLPIIPCITARQLKSRSRVPSASRRLAWLQGTMGGQRGRAGCCSGECAAARRHPQGDRQEARGVRGRAGGQGPQGGAGGARARLLCLQSSVCRSCFILRSPDHFQHVQQLPADWLRMRHRTVSTTRPGCCFLRRLHVICPCCVSSAMERWAGRATERLLRHQT